MASHLDCPRSTLLSTPFYPSQQFVKERAIYRRERMVNLRLDTYVLSKFLPLAVIAAGQCALMLAVVGLFRSGGGSLWTHFSVLALATWGGVALGLIISALASNEEKATGVVPLVMLPQIMLAGVLVTLPDMNRATWAASQLVLAKWANQGQEVALIEGQTLKPDLLEQLGYARLLWNLYPKYNLGTEEGRLHFLGEKEGEVLHKAELLTGDYLALGAFIVVQLVVVGVLLRRQDPF